MIEALIFYLFAAVAVLAGAAVLLGRNIVRIAYWLIAMLTAVAGLYFLLGAFFLGAIQLIVYVGGVAVLVVFGVMLSSRRLAERMFATGAELAAAAAVGLVILAGLIVAVLAATWPEPKTETVASVRNLGAELLGRFLGPFELASVLLLIVLLGAAYLARPRVPQLGRSASQENENHE